MLTSPALRQVPLPRRLLPQTAFSWPVDIAFLSRASVLVHVTLLFFWFFSQTHLNQHNKEAPNGARAVHR